MLTRGNNPLHNHCCLFSHLCQNPFLNLISIPLLLVSLGEYYWCFFSQSVTLSQPVENIPNNSVSSMNVFQAFILGMVQGLTEFIPISSTAHLKAIPVALGWGDPGVTFTAIIQLGSIVAVLWYFWQDLMDLGVGITKAIRNQNYQTQEFKIGVGIVIGTIPIVIFGLMLKLFVKDLDNSAFRSMTTIAIASIVMAILLALSEKFSQHQRDFEHLSTKDGILMGFAQSLALIPGVSRSGSTITAGLFMNLQRATAARFSFLLGIPAITLAGLVEFKDVFSAGYNSTSIVSLIVALISSGIFFLFSHSLANSLFTTSRYMGFRLVSSSLWSCDSSGNF